MIDMLAANSGRVTNLRRVTYIVLDEADRMFVSSSTSIFIFLCLIAGIFYFEFFCFTGHGLRATGNYYTHTFISNINQLIPYFSLHMY